MRQFGWLCLVVLPSLAWSQPTLSSLWPNDDGTTWSYDFTVKQPFDGVDFAADATLRLDGTVQTPGGTAQVLIGNHPIPPAVAGPSGLDPVLRAVWRARPDLRAAIEAKAARSTAGDVNWWPLFLHYGYFMKNATDIQMWQPKWDHPTWTYLREPISVGSSFVHQLVPELADDVFLHGTIESTEATVVTAAGTYEHAVRVRYLIDYGVSEGVDEHGDPVGHFHSETRGHVHYVPDVGPVDLLEDFILYASVDCGDNPCPPEWTEHLGLSYQTLTLSLRPPVGVAQRTWGEIKSIYR